jgi:hypothetical protein
MMNKRPRILTKSVLAGIPALIEQGLHRGEIAERLGCKLSTLQVRCSKAGISLRGRNRLELGNGTPLLLSREAIVSLKARAASNGYTEAQLATDLIETIARDNLYDAVLDLAPPLSPQLGSPRFGPAAKVR